MNHISNNERFEFVTMAAQKRARFCICGMLVFILTFTVFIGVFLGDGHYALAATNEDQGQIENIFRPESVDESADTIQGDAGSLPKESSFRVKPIRLETVQRAFVAVNRVEIKSDGNLADDRVYQLVPEL